MAIGDVIGAQAEEIQMNKAPLPDEWLMVLGNGRRGDQGASDISSISTSVRRTRCSWAFGESCGTPRQTGTGSFVSTTVRWWWEQWEKGGAAVGRC